MFVLQVTWKHNTYLNCCRNSLEFQQKVQNLNREATHFLHCVWRITDVTVGGISNIWHLHEGPFILQEVGLQKEVTPKAELVLMHSLCPLK